MYVCTYILHINDSDIHVCNVVLFSHREEEIAGNLSGYMESTGMLTEIRLVQRDKYCIFSIIYGNKKENMKIKCYLWDEKRSRGKR